MTVRGFPWTCLTMAGRKPIPRQEPARRDLERPQQAPRNPAGAQTCDSDRVYTPGTPGPCGPRSRERDDLSATEGAAVADVHKNKTSLLRYRSGAHPRQFSRLCGPAQPLIADGKKYFFRIDPRDFLRFRFILSQKKSLLLVIVVRLFFVHTTIMLSSSI